MHCAPRRRRASCWCSTTCIDIEKSEAFELLDSLIERLPDHVAVVLGSRVEPPLSLARWRAYGELGVFTPEDLQFTHDEAARAGAGALRQDAR